ncbi:hypothetical protein [Candidatus Lokiarchaeum ossiferum]|uniref:hypothetical protein n=1 Tax=Candidatus Lokiarchaeum ossiferum TaxID=2951803 RepID=UPI00352C1D4E
MSSDSEQFKICRQCHVVYKKLSQKFCGNGCQNKPPFFIEGKKRNSIEQREIILNKNEENIIRWVCISCKREYTETELQEIEYICECNTKNDFYPFTFKSCANVECKSSDNFHSLPLEAKACDLCGKTNFIINKSKSMQDLIPNLPNRTDHSEEWDLEKFDFFEDLAEERKNRNLPSITFTILNNNLKYILFGEGKVISMYDIIRDANGFTPDSIYEHLLEKYPKETTMFDIKYNSVTEEYTFKSIISMKEFELDPRFNPKSKAIIREAGIEFNLPEGKLLEFRGGIFKIHIWVY